MDENEIEDNTIGSEYNDPTKDSSIISVDTDMSMVSIVSPMDILKKSPSKSPKSRPEKLTIVIRKYTIAYLFFRCNLRISYFIQLANLTPRTIDKMTKKYDELKPVEISKITKQTKKPVKRLQKSEKVTKSKAEPMPAKRNLRSNSMIEIQFRNI